MCLQQIVAHGCQALELSTNLPNWLNAGPVWVDKSMSEQSTGDDDDYYSPSSDEVTHEYTESFQQRIFKILEFKMILA